MKLFDYIRTAAKNIRLQKLRSALTVCAVVIGAISVLIMLSLVFSARSVFLQQLESIGAFTLVTVSPNPDIEVNGGNLFGGNGGDSGSDGQILTDDTIAELKTTPHVQALTPFLSVWSLKSMRLEDIEKKYYTRLSALDPTATVIDFQLVAGRLLHADDMAAVLMSTDTARKFGYEKNPQDLVGKNIIFQTQEGYSGWGVTVEKPPMNADKEWWETHGRETHEISAEIVGVVDMGMAGGEDYITLNWAKEVMTNKRWEIDEEAVKQYEEARQLAESQYQRFDEPYPEMVLKTETEQKQRGYQAIMLKVDDTANVATVAAIMKAKKFGVSTAEEMMTQINKIFTLLSAVLGTIGAIALFVATLGIINTMIMATYERTREIGVMRACGATRRTIRLLFTSEAALLGFLGGCVGIGISLGLVAGGNFFANKFIADQGVSLQDVIVLPVWLMGSVVTLTTIVGMLAGLYPAIRASRLDPVEALRHE